MDAPARTAEGGRKVTVKTKWIQIEGAIEIPADMDVDVFSAELEQMITDKGWNLLAYTWEEER